MHCQARFRLTILETRPYTGREGESMDNRIKSLLSETGRDHAVAFLRKVFDPSRNLTLVEAVQALSLELVEPHKADITVSDIVAPASHSDNKRDSSKQHRVRLAEHDKKTIKNSVYELISSEPEGMTMEAIVAAAQEKHANANRILIAALTRELEKEGRLHGNDKRPKVWVAVTSGKKPRQQ
jgi:hypothetical protein